MAKREPGERSRQPTPPDADHDRMPGASALQPPLAGLARRSLAWVLDTLIASLIIFAGVTAVDLAVGPIVQFRPEAAQLVDVIQVDRAVTLLAALLAAGLGIAYFALPWAMVGASPVQGLLGIRVRDVRSAGNPSIARAVLRWLVLFPPFASISALVATDLPGSGWLLWGAALAWYPVLLISAALDPQRRGLHDALAGTLVAMAPSWVARKAAHVR